MPVERPWVLGDATWPMVRDAAYKVAVLPWGATEAHNYHLPYATDTIETTSIANDAARLAWDAGAHVVVLPAVPFGVNTGQLDIPLCINMNPSTQLAVLRDIVSVVELAKIEKLVVVNGHGGNDFRQMIRELQPTTSSFLCTTNWYNCIDATQYFDAPGDHAGELETSMMQHLANDIVRPLSEAGDGYGKRFKIRALREGWAWAPRHWTEVTADTGVGDPRAATAAKGARFFEAVTKQLADFFVELAAADLSSLYGS